MGDLDLVTEETVELLLAATYLASPDRRATLKFVFGSPGTPPYAGNLGAHLSVSHIGLLKTALYARKHGPAYLRHLSMREIEGQLTRFLMENFWILARETWSRQFDDSFAEVVGAGTKRSLASALGRSRIFAPPIAATVFPLVPIKVANDFDSEPFFLVRPEGLTAELLRRPLDAAQLTPTLFPPFDDWNGTFHNPSAWLGVRAPCTSTAFKRRSAILGAVALLPHRSQRHTFSARAMFGGCATLDKNWSFSFGEAHTPPLFDDISLSAEDHPWMQMLALKLASPVGGAGKQAKALEYYYRAWALDEAERFPILFQALDAVYGDAGQATQAIIVAVGRVMDEAFDYPRLKLLLSLRASVVHGGAPDVYDSDKYFGYYETYGEDPIHDLEQITAAALQSEVFEGALVSRPHSHAEVLKARTRVAL